MAHLIYGSKFSFDYACIYLNILAQGLRVYMLMLIKIVTSGGFELRVQSTGALNLFNWEYINESYAIAKINTICKEKEMCKGSHMLGSGSDVTECCQMSVEKIIICSLQIGCGGFTMTLPSYCLINIYSLIKKLPIFLPLWPFTQ